jgi:acyl carrier protein
MDEKLLEEVVTVMRAVLDQPALDADAQLRLEDLPNWNSLKCIELMVSLESSLGVRYTLAQLRGMRTVGELVSLTRRKLATRG